MGLIIHFCVLFSDPDVPSGVHEDNGIKYEFKVYQRDV